METLCRFVGTGYPRPCVIPSGVKRALRAEHALAAAFPKASGECFWESSRDLSTEINLPRATILSVERSLDSALRYATCCALLDFRLVILRPHRQEVE